MNESVTEVCVEQPLALPGSAKYIFQSVAILAKHGTKINQYPTRPEDIFED